MKIAIITTLVFPSGNASINRIISYSKGLVESGIEVVVYSTNHGSKKIKEIDGIKYIGLGGATNVIGIFDNLMSLIGLIQILAKTKPKHDAIVLVSNSLLLIYPLFFVCKLRDIRFLLEKSEFPFVLMHNGIFGRAYAWFYVMTTYKLFDGLIIMTNPLFEYFNNKVRKKCKNILIPMTVDSTRFSSVKRENNVENYIAYCGDMGGEKDGVKILIDSFSSVEKAHPSFYLYLIGSTKDKEELLAIKEYAKDQGIKNIRFTGWVDRSRIPELLINAKILALARPNNLQSEGGFPTKLGEYLSTGNPTVVTDVGEISRYLKNNYQAYIVPPGNSKLFSEKLIAFVGHISTHLPHLVQFSSSII